MTDLFVTIPENIKLHIKEISKVGGIPGDEETLQKIAEAWIEKEKSFEEKIKSLNMEEVDFLDIEDQRGALILTYSGSLINLSVLNNGKRKVEYASIGIRKDVPELLVDEDSELLSNLIKDERIEFKSGLVKKTSPIYKIAVCRNNVNAEKQKEILKEASTIIMEDFVEVNKTRIHEEE